MTRNAEQFVVNVLDLIDCVDLPVLESETVDYLRQMIAVDTFDLPLFVALIESKHRRPLRGGK